MASAAGSRQGNVSTSRPPAVHQPIPSPAPPAPSQTAEEPGDNDQDDIAISLTQDEVNRLSAICGKNILTSSDLLSQMTFLTCVSVQGAKIPIEPGLLSRLKSRCYKQEFHVFLKEVITKQLHDYCGW